MVLVTDPAQKAQFQADLQKQEKQKLEQQKKAEALQEESRRLSEESERVLRPHERMALAMTLIQIAVAMASITVLTQRRWLLAVSILSALGGIGLAASSWF